VRVLGVTTPKRVASAPEIPTLAEGGCPALSWSRGGVVAPAAVPRPIIDQLAGQIGKLMADPATATSSPRLRWSAGRIDAGQFCGLHQDRGRSLGGDRQEFGRGAGMKNDVLGAARRIRREHARND
jgi:hypothetical protein